MLTRGKSIVYPETIYWFDQNIDESVDMKNKMFGDRCSDKNK